MNCMEFVIRFEKRLPWAWEQWPTNTHVDPAAVDLGTTPPESLDILSAIRFCKECEERGHSGKEPGWVGPHLLGVASKGEPRATNEYITHYSKWGTAPAGSD